MALEISEARLMLAEAALVGGDFETARTEAEAAAKAFARQRRPPWTALARYAALRAASSSTVARPNDKGLQDAQPLPWPRRLDRGRARRAPARCEDRARSRRHRRRETGPRARPRRAARTGRTCASAPSTRAPCSRSRTESAHAPTRRCGRACACSTTTASRSARPSFGRTSANRPRSSPRSGSAWRSRTPSRRACWPGWRSAAPAPSASGPSGRRTTRSWRRARRAAAHRRRRPGGSVRGAGRGRPAQAPGDARGLGPATHPPRAGRDPRRRRRDRPARAGRARRARPDRLPGGRGRAPRRHGVRRSRAPRPRGRRGGGGRSSTRCGSRCAGSRGAPRLRRSQAAASEAAATRRPGSTSCSCGPSRRDRRAAAGPRPYRRAARDAVVELVPSAGRAPVVVAPSAACGAAQPTARRPAVRRNRVTIAARARTRLRRRMRARWRSCTGWRRSLPTKRRPHERCWPRSGRRGVAHLAAHGRFRADNPLFSSIDLADGPLTVYDLESLEEAPDALCPLGLRLRPLGGEAGRRADGAHRHAVRPRQRDDRRERGHRSRRGEARR